jgi:hypothetical protein
MARPAFFALTESELNRFLLAPIGEERNGMMLSVFSALARLDLDPWVEAARLADLPGETATEALTQAITRLSDSWMPSDARRIAERLVLLLPSPADTQVPDPARAMRSAARVGGAPNWLFWLLLGTLAAGVTLFFVA